MGITEPGYFSMVGTRISPTSSQNPESSSSSAVSEPSEDSPDSGSEGFVTGSVCSVPSSEGSSVPRLSSGTDGLVMSSTGSVTSVGSETSVEEFSVSSPTPSVATVDVSSAPPPESGGSVATVETVPSTVSPAKVGTTTP